MYIYLPYKEYHSRHGERHFTYKEMSKTRLFHINISHQDFARLNNNFIIIYHNYFGMTVKTLF